MEIKREDLLELLVALLLEEELSECDCDETQVESFDSIEDLIASLEGEDYEFCGCEGFGCEEESCVCDECSCEAEKDVLEGIEESLSRVLNKKKTDEDVLSEMAIEQEKLLEELRNQYKSLTEEEYELSQEYMEEEIDKDTLELDNKAECLLNSIEDNLESICVALEAYWDSRVVIDKNSIRDLEDIRTLTFLADDIFGSLLERSEVKDI